MHPEAATMTADPVGGPSPPASPRNSPAIEHLSLTVVLDHLATRIASLEEQLTRRASPGGAGKAIEVLKALSGWPTFGLVFLVLFYVPLRDAIGAIPDKVKQAEQIELLGVSLKSTLRVEAQKIGAISLSETLPALSPRAVELLLRGVRDREESLLSYSLEENLITRVWLPSPQLLDVLDELEKKGLVAVVVHNGQSETAGIPAMKQAIAALRRERAGHELSSTDPSRIEWKLERPMRFETPIFGWRHTDLGKKAVDVILSAVSSQLTATAAPNPT